MTVEWIDDYTAKINGGGDVEFVGIIRGEGAPMIRYIASSTSEIVDELEIRDWIYVIRKRR